MSLLKAPPTREIRMLDELLAVARAVELQAAGRYGELAALMRSGGNEAVADVLAALEVEERARAREIAGRSGAGADAEQVRAGLVGIGWADLFDAEDLGSSRLVTPYAALSVAVRNEERLFSFWSYVSSQATATDVRREAERLAVDALTHVARLRKERRRAFHSGREGRRRDGRPEEFPQRAKLRLLRLSGALAEAADRLEDEAVAAALRKIAAEQRAEADLIEPDAEGADPVSGDAAEPAGAQSRNELDRAVGLVEEALDRCFEAAERSRDESVVALAQHLAQRGVVWLARLREMEA